MTKREKRNPSLFFAALVALGMLATAVTARAVSPDTAPICEELGHGFNLGNALEAPREGSWGVTLRDEYFKAIEEAGFTTVRVPISWSAHADLTAPYAIDGTFWMRIDWVVHEAEIHHLHAILDFHNDDDLTRDPSRSEARFLGLWKQIAEHYQKESSTILFEIYNEPHDALDAEKWNALLLQALAVIRPTNPTRWVVVGPVQWNGIGALSSLRLPGHDRYLLATVHFYDPMTFTHQGAAWVPGSSAWLGTKWLGTDAEKQAIDGAMDRAAAWAAAQGRPLLLGEFGAYEKGDMDSRARWTATVARAAEAHGMAWIYWEFCSGFGAYDPVAHAWRTPLLQALKPTGTSL